MKTFTLTIAERSSIIEAAGNEIKNFFFRHRIQAKDREHIMEKFNHDKNNVAGFKQIVRENPDKDIGIQIRHERKKREPKTSTKTEAAPRRYNDCYRKYWEEP